MNKYQEAYEVLYPKMIKDDDWESIGARATLQELVEKATPKKVEDKEFLRKTSIGERFNWWCPNCNFEHMSDKIRYCPSCGQALSWSGSDE